MTGLYWHLVARQRAVGEVVTAASVMGGGLLILPGMVIDCGMEDE